MRMRLTAAVLCAAATGWAVSAVQAQASVIYTFTTTSAANTTNPTAPPANLDLIFDLLDATVQSGTFRLTTTPNLIPPPGEAISYTSGANDFRKVSFSVGGFGDVATPAVVRDIINIGMTFAANGDVIGSSVAFDSFTEGVRISGTGPTASGFVGTDNTTYQCFGFTNCAVSGVWTHSASADPVPEPATFALLGAGLLGLATMRRRAA